MVVNCFVIICLMHIKPCVNGGCLYLKQKAKKTERETSKKTKNRHLRRKAASEDESSESER